jgi:hypothetical protein
MGLSVARADRTGAAMLARSGVEGVTSGPRGTCSSHLSDLSGHVTEPGVFSLIPRGITQCRSSIETKREARNRMSILWIILIVILVLALLGFFSRGRW